MWLLAAAAVGALALALAAVGASRAYHAAVDRSLERLAEIASWQLTEQVGGRLEDALEQTLWPVRQFGVVGDDGFPPVEAFVGFAPDPTDCPCPLPFAARFYFRLDLETRQLTTSGELLDQRQEAALGDALDQVLRQRTAEAVLAPWTDQSGATYLALTVLPDRSGRPRGAYGAAVPPSALGPILDRAITEAELLPASVLPRGDHSDLYVTKVRDHVGRSLFERVGGAASDYGGSAVLGDGLGRMRIDHRLTEAARAALTPGAAAPPWIMASLLVAVAMLFWAAFRSLATERRLLATQRRFVTAISHDLRTPLTQIRLYAEMLRLGRVRSDGERTSCLDFIDLESRRLSHVIENALAVGRGPEEMPPLEPVDIGPLAREEIARYEGLAPGASIRFTGPDRRITARARPDPVRRILVNLMDNAVKYAPGRGGIDVGLEVRGDRVRLSVVDRGPGIDPADRERVFRPFVRLDQGWGHTTGSGLGLAVVRDLVGALGGSVWIESVEPTGTAVVVELERARADGAARPDGSAP